MLLGQIFNSITAWQKLSAIPLKPKVAYVILKYTKLVGDEHALAEKQRVALIHELTNTLEGQDAKLEPKTPEFEAYVVRFNEIMSTESDLKPIDMELDVVVNALDDKDEVLSVQDLALLEVFFASSEIDPPEDVDAEVDKEFRNKDGTPKTELD